MTEKTRGRPRSERARVAIMEAARDLLIEVGFEKLSMDVIASTAGVGKQTVYRWWPSKSAVVAEAVLEGIIPAPTTDLPDTGDLRADMAVWLGAFVDAVSHPAGADLVRALAVAVATDSAAGAALYRQITGPEWDALVARLHSAQLRDQVRPDADLRGASDALASFGLFLVLARQSISYERAAGVLDVVLTGIETVRR